MGGKGGKAFQREDQGISRNDREFVLTAFGQTLSLFTVLETWG